MVSNFYKYHEENDQLFIFLGKLENYGQLKNKNHLDAKNRSLEFLLLHRNV